MPNAENFQNYFSFSKFKQMLCSVLVKQLNQQYPRDNCQMWGFLVWKADPFLRPLRQPQDMNYVCRPTFGRCTSQKGSLDLLSRMWHISSLETDTSEYRYQTDPLALAPASYSQERHTAPQHGCQARCQQFLPDDVKSPPEKAPRKCQCSDAKLETQVCTLNLTWLTMALFWMVTVQGGRLLFQI